MLIYGWNTKNIKQAEVKFYECPNCKEKSSTLAIFGSYAHVFWIPTFPYKKSAELHCSNCGHVSEDGSLDPETTAAVKKLKSSVSFPKYMFAGSLIILILISLFAFNIYRDNQIQQEYAANPEIGDVFLILDKEEPTEYNHYFLKINEVTTDSIWVSVSSYSYNGIVEQMDPNDGFYDVQFSMHKSALVDYEDSGLIKKAMRDYPSSTGFDRLIHFEMPDSLSFD